VNSARVTLFVLLAAQLLLGANVDVPPRVVGGNCDAAVIVDGALPKPVDDVFSSGIPRAEALLLLDRNTGIALLERNADALRVVASTVKILTALTVIQHADMNDVVRIQPEAVRTIGATIGLQAGQEYPVHVLLTGLITRSGNDAAAALAAHVSPDETAFVALMRDEAVKLGIEGATINDPTGLSDTNRLSARHLAILANAALANPLLAPLFAQPSFRLGESPAVPNRNVLIGRYVGATGVKTGFTTRAGHALVASAQRDGRELIAVVLSAGSDAARFARAEQLLDFGFTRTFARSLDTELSWHHSYGVSHWRIPDSTVIAAGSALAVVWTLPEDPYQPLQVQLLLDQNPFCDWRSIPLVARSESPETVGEIIRGIVGHGYGAALLEQTSGSLRVPVQGARS